MSRSTHYIGLTYDARSYIERLRNSGSIISESEVFLCEGMSGESIYGKKWTVYPPPGPNVAEELLETVQTIVWSSGPMVFTCLQATLVKENGQLLTSDEPYFRWVLNPEIEYEVDREKGHYFV